MDPVTAMVGISVVSGLMQYYQSEKARKASKQRLAEIERMFDAIVPPDFNVSVWDDPKLVASIPEPAFNLEKITPELYESVGQYVPQVAEFVKEKAPELVKASADAQTGRQAQMDALERYKQLSRSDFDPELQQKLAEASRRSRTDAQSREASVLQDANRRGQGGSLATMATQQIGGEASMQRAAQESQMAAAESYRNKLRALDQSANLGGQIRQSEMGEASRNADIINDFNERTSTRYQQYGQMRADQANQAQMRNLGERQRISDANVGQRNDAQKEWIGRGNAMAQQGYQNRRQTQQDLQNVEKYKNELKQNMYGNEMSRAQGKAGLAQQGIADIQHQAQDKNQMIQGLGNAGMTGASAYYQGQQEDDREQRRMAHEEEMRRKYPSSYGGGYS